MVLGTFYLFFFGKPRLEFCSQLLVVYRFRIQQIRISFHQPTAIFNSSRVFLTLCLEHIAKSIIETRSKRDMEYLYNYLDLA